MAEVLEVEIKHGVAVLTLNRPERRNAINAELGAAISRALVQVAKDPAVGAMILTGAGQGFCAGGDADYLADKVVGGVANGLSPDEPDPAFLEAVPEAPPHMRTRYTFAGAMPIPTLAVVNGAAVGAGLALAMSCDFRLGSPEAYFVAPFSRIGMTTEMGLAWTLSRTIGLGPARDMLLSGRRIDAEEALRWGLVTRIWPGDDLQESSFEFARELAERCSRRSISRMKQELDIAASQTFAEAFETSRLGSRAAIRTASFKEGIAAVREKRRPVWPIE